MGSSPAFEKVGECLYRNSSSGTYYALVKVRGKQIKRSLRTDNLPEARRKLRDFKIEVSGLDPTTGRVSLRDLVKRYRPTFAHLAEDTRENKNRVLDRVVESWPGGADRHVGRIKASEAKTFLARYTGASGYNHALETVRSLFDLAVADGIIAKSPVADLKYRRRETPIRPTPTMEEFRAIVDSIRNQPFSDTGEESADLVEFWGLSGMGRAEAAALKCSDVNLERNQFRTFRQKTRTGFIVPIFPQLRPLLEKKLAEVRERNGGKLPPDERLFRVADAKKAIATACNRLGLPVYSSRAFRRMFITTAIERGVDVKVIAQWQGHQDGGKLILDTYSHVRPLHSEQMAKLMTWDGAA